MVQVGCHLFKNFNLAELVFGTNTTLLHYKMLILINLRKKSNIILLVLSL